jgi:hypothetical protein
VVVLRVVFEDFRFLLVVEIANEPVEIEVFPPFLTVNEPVQEYQLASRIMEYCKNRGIHFLCQRDIKLPGSQEP